MANCKIRFFDNNYLDSNATFSSEVAINPFTNAVDMARTRVWKTEGHFEITSSNNKLYINDGSIVDITLDYDHYDNADDLATHIQTKLNASSSGWAVSYSSTTYRFTISNSGSVTLRLTQTTNSVWDTLGYTGTADATGTSFVADEIRLHTSEFVEYDLGGAREVTFGGMIAEIDEVFTISEDATITLSANNVPVWTSPALQETMSRSDRGAFAMFDDDTDTFYRYWRFEFSDRRNSNGPESFKIGYIYLGDHAEITSSNVAYGFGRGQQDPSIRSQSEYGVEFFDTRPKYETFSSMSIQNLSAADKLTLDQVFNDFGVHTPLFVSIDPLLKISDSLDDYTRYVRFVRMPTAQHIIRNYYSLSLELKEVI